MFPIFHGISSHVLSGGGGSDVYGSVWEDPGVWSAAIPGFLCESPKGGRGGRTAGIRGKIGSGLYHGCAVGAWEPFGIRHALWIKPGFGSVEDPGYVRNLLWTTGRRYHFKYQNGREIAGTERRCHHYVRGGSHGREGEGPRDGCDLWERGKWLLYGAWGHTAVPSYGSGGQHGGVKAVPRNAGMDETEASGHQPGYLDGGHSENRGNLPQHDGKHDPDGQYVCGDGGGSGRCADL